MKLLDRYTTPQVALFAIGLFILLYAWAGYLADSPSPVETRSSTPEAWTPATASEATPTEVP